MLFYTKYTYPTLICGGTDTRTDAHTENIYSIFRDKLLLLGELGFVVVVGVGNQQVHLGRHYPHCRAKATHCFWDIGIVDFVGSCLADLVPIISRENDQVIVCSLLFCHSDGG